MKIPPLLEIPRISIGAGLAAILLVLALTAVYVMVPAQHQGAVIFFGAGIASAAAIATAFYTAKTLHIAHVRHEREPQEAAARFAERWNDAAMFHVRTACQEIMEMRNRNRDDVKAKIESNPQSRNNILHILNFLEELGMAIRAGRADHPYSKDCLPGSSLMCTMCFSIGSRRSVYVAADQNCGWSYVGCTSGGAKERIDIRGLSRQMLTQ